MDYDPPRPPDVGPGGPALFMLGILISIFLFAAANGKVVW